jgi:hypothetical protein
VTQTGHRVTGLSKVGRAGRAILPPVKAGGDVRPRFWNDSVFAKGSHHFHERMPYGLFALELSEQIIQRSFPRCMAARTAEGDSKLTPDRSPSRRTWRNPMLIVRRSRKYRAIIGRRCEAYSPLTSGYNDLVGGSNPPSPTTQSDANQCFAVSDE